MAYTVAMAEVAVGSGAQLGRLAGGLLFDLGGFGCPFLVASVQLDSFNADSNARVFRSSDSIGPSSRGRFPFALSSA